MVSQAANSTFSALRKVGNMHGMSQSHTMLFIASVSDVVMVACQIVLARTESYEDMDQILESMYAMHDRHMDDIVKFMQSIGVKMEINYGERRTTEEPGQGQGHSS